MASLLLVKMYFPLCAHASGTSECWCTRSQFDGKKATLLEHVVQYALFVCITLYMMGHWDWIMLQRWLRKGQRVLSDTCMWQPVCVCVNQDTIELLQARVSALDSVTLDQVEARLQVTRPCAAYRTMQIATSDSDIPVHTNVAAAFCWKESKVKNYP